MADTRGFTRASAEALSERLGEPDWLRARRIEAVEKLSATRRPTAADEDWRRMDLAAVDFEALAELVTPNGGAASPDPEDAAGVIHFVDGVVVGCHLEAGLAAQGVVLASLSEAAATHEDLVRRYLHTAAVPADESWFTLLHAGLWTTGTFCWVPAGVTVEAPIVSIVELSHGGVATMHHTLVLAGEGASVQVIDESRGGGGDLLSVPVAEIYAERGAAVGYHAVQSWARGASEFAVRRAVVEQEARATVCDAAVGGTRAKCFVGARLVGRGADCKLYGMYFPEAGQHFDYTTLQDHRVPDCTSDLLFKGALADRAKSSFRGVVRVHPDAQRTDAYQTNNNLLLGDDARADSMPVLEIEADDVKCSHGATLAHLDEEDLFYLTSRGLPRDAAQRMIIGGFFEQIIDRIPQASLRERLEAQVTGHIDRQQQ